MWWSWKNSFWTVSTFRGCSSRVWWYGGLERTDFEQFLLSEGVVVLKELILNSFYFQEGVVFMKELILHSFYFERVWWSWKNWFWTVSTFRGCSSRVWWCGGLERTDSEQFLLWDGVVVGCGHVVVLKELILNSFYFQRVWWSWKDWFWTVSTLGGCGGRCGGLERTDFEHISTFRGCGGLERTDFEQFLLWEGLVVLKGLSFNSFYFGRVWWSWKNWFWTVYTFRGCGGHERTDFEQFLLSEGAVLGCGGVVALKELILNSFYFGRVWMVLKELILNSFYFRRVWWSWKNWFWTLSTFRGWGGLERTVFEQFLLSEGVVVLKELVLNHVSTLGGVVVGCGVWWSWKNWFWTVSTFTGCGGLERTGFWTHSTFRGCGGLERTEFEQFLLWEGVVVLKELILNSFYFQRVWWSWKKDLILNSFYFQRVQ